MSKNLLFINNLENIDITEFVSYINTENTKYILLNDDTTDILQKVADLGETAYDNMGIIQHGDIKTYIGDLKLYLNAQFLIKVDKTDHEDDCCTDEEIPEEKDTKYVLKDFDFTKLKHR
tara:strand:+ start:31 stop:387 length:357 start_codon:yes stop_codon:yes gene_type:complete